MNTLEIMQNGIDYTNKRLYEQNRALPEYQDMTDGQLQYQSVLYSSQILDMVSKSSDQSDKIYTAYTRSGNLRYDMQTLTSDAIKNELLKNMVNVASWHRIKGTMVSKQIGDQINTQSMSDDQISVVMLNNLERYGAEKGYELLNDPNILASACRTFAWYRRSYEMTEVVGYINNGSNLEPVYNKNAHREELDVISQSYPLAVDINHDLDVYYARYENSPKGVDTSVLDSYGYDGYGGFSGFGRK